MSKDISKKEAIRKKALEILNRPEYKTGIRWGDLIKLASIETGEKNNTCTGSLYNWPNEEPEKVARPYRGLFILKENISLVNTEQETAQIEKKTQPYTEHDIYEPARIHLLGKEECTHAVVIGSSIFGQKWGTPDILGAIRVSSYAVYKPPLEIVAVEVKDPSYRPVEALGQAMAYKLFAHRTWLVLPEDKEIDRIEGIAISANIGLLKFTYDDNKKDFDFEILNRPKSEYPDPDAVNKMLETLKEKDRQKYNDLIINEISKK